MELTPVLISTNTSGFKGVTWNKTAKAYIAKIQVNGKYIYLGYRDTARAAAELYADAAVRYFGEFARTK